MLSSHILIECADLLEIRKKYFEEKPLYLLFRNAIPEIIFDFLREIGVFYNHHHHYHHHHHQPLNREGRWGTTDDFATSFLHFSLLSTAL